MIKLIYSVLGWTHSPLAGELIRLLATMLGNAKPPVTYYYSIAVKTPSITAIKHV